MRIFTISDVHIDYKTNFEWFKALSKEDFTDDILLLAGDVSHLLERVRELFALLVLRFAKVLFVPGNHDIWVGQNGGLNSLEKFDYLLKLCGEYGIFTSEIILDKCQIVPLFSWYDYSFGKPNEEILHRWSDFKQCRWPVDFGVEEITTYFLNKNTIRPQNSKLTITISHFMPRLDILPSFIRYQGRMYAPILGCTKLDVQLRKYNPVVHIYGHSHINVEKKKRGIIYLNNAMGNPQEQKYTRMSLFNVSELLPGE